MTNLLIVLVKDVGGNVLFPLLPPNLTCTWHEYLVLGTFGNIPHKLDPIVQTWIYRSLPYIQGWQMIFYEDWLLTLCVSVDPPQGSQST